MVHVIDGLGDGRFAVLGQMHHALADGVTALRIVDWWLSDDPKAQDVPPIWAFKRPRRRSRRPGRTNPLRSAIAALGTGARGVTGGLHAIRRTLTGLSARPWSAPGSAINGAITARRRVATQSFEMERFRTLSECTGGTINDVVLAVCAGGLRAYLEEIGELPERPLVTNMPVSVRREDSEADVGNAISWAMLALATDIDDVRERFEAIQAATVQAKQRLRAMPPSAVDAYTLLAVSPILAEQLLRMGGRVPPLFNVPISNVPGPRDRLFLDGAALDELHALTVIYDGYGLVIVAVSYGDRLQMSFTACPDTLPHSQHLALHCGRALEELEATYRAVGLRSQGSGRVTVPPRQDGPVDRP